MVDILTGIVADIKLDVERRKIERPIEKLGITLPVGDPHTFREAITRKDRTNIIAEIKKASPSKGIFRDDFDCERLAAEYRLGGAAALSVLTEKRHFLGSFHNLERARHISHLPVLCKDFIVDEYQIFEARSHGAHAVLLIAAILTKDKMAAFRKQATHLGMETLVEIHDEVELANALDSGADIIGVNSRNLKDFSVNLKTAHRLAANIPAEIATVAESGIENRHDIENLLASGFDAFLIGESLVRSSDPAGLLRQLQGLA